LFVLRRSCAEVKAMAIQMPPLDAGITQTTATTNSAFFLSPTIDTKEHLQEHRIRVWAACFCFLPVPPTSCSGVLVCHSTQTHRRAVSFDSSPKSMMWMMFWRFPSPMRKLSGFTSRWMKLFV